MAFVGNRFNAVGGGGGIAFGATVVKGSGGGGGFFRRRERRHWICSKRNGFEFVVFIHSLLKRG